MLTRQSEWIRHRLQIWNELEIKDINDSCKYPLWYNLHFDIDTEWQLYKNIYDKHVLDSP
jgi:hypothetical protein